MLLTQVGEQDGDTQKFGFQTRQGIKKSDLNKVFCSIIPSHSVQGDLKAWPRYQKNHSDALIAYKFYKSCLYDKLITLSLTAAHSKGSKGAGLRGDGP